MDESLCNIVILQNVYSVDYILYLFVNQSIKSTSPFR
jgi:hypothetical protein